LDTVSIKSNILQDSWNKRLKISLPVTVHVHNFEQILLLYLEVITVQHYLCAGQVVLFITLVALRRKGPGAVIHPFFICSFRCYI